MGHKLWRQIKWKQTRGGKKLKDILMYIHVDIKPIQSCEKMDLRRLLSLNAATVSADHFRHRLVWSFEASSDIWAASITPAHWESDTEADAGSRPNGDVFVLCDCHQCEIADATLSPVAGQSKLQTVDAVSENLESSRRSSFFTSSLNNKKKNKKKTHDWKLQPWKISSTCFSNLHSHSTAVTTTWQMFHDSPN